jgi:hypothetical protein
MSQLSATMGRRSRTKGTRKKKEAQRFRDKTSSNTEIASLIFAVLRSLKHTSLQPNQTHMSWSVLTNKIPHNPSTGPPLGPFPFFPPLITKQQPEPRWYATKKKKKKANI